MKNESFYMVYLEGGNAPKQKHETLQSAESEAKRLSKEFRKRAYVLATLKSFEILEFIEKDCRPDVDLPF